MFRLSFVWTLCAGLLAAQSFEPLLPPGAKVIEVADLTKTIGKSRALVLWMLQPEKVFDDEWAGAAVYGDFCEGPARISLVDLRARTLINTHVILGREEVDSLRLPFHVRGAYYFVPRPGNDRKGTPQILKLQDFTGDGVAAEFVLYLHEATGIVSTSVFGYQASSDRVIGYPVRVSEPDGTSIERWVMQVFAEKPVRPGTWKFKWRRGHGSDAIIHEEMSFVPKEQIFFNKRTFTQAQ